MTSDFGQTLDEFNSFFSHKTQFDHSTENSWVLGNLSRFFVKNGFVGGINQFTNTAEIPHFVFDPLNIRDSILNQNEKFIENMGTILSEDELTVLIRKIDQINTAASRIILNDSFNKEKFLRWIEIFKPTKYSYLPIIYLLYLMKLTIPQDFPSYFFLSLHELRETDLITYIDILLYPRGPSVPFSQEVLYFIDQDINTLRENQEIILEFLKSHTDFQTDNKINTLTAYLCKKKYKDNEYIISNLWVFLSYSEHPPNTSSDEILAHDSENEIILQRYKTANNIVSELHSLILFGHWEGFDNSNALFNPPLYFGGFNKHLEGDIKIVTTCAIQRIRNLLRSSKFSYTSLGIRENLPDDPRFFMSEEFLFSGFHLQIRPEFCFYYEILPDEIQLKNLKWSGVSLSGTILLPENNPPPNVKLVINAIDPISHNLIHESREVINTENFGFDLISFNSPPENIEVAIVLGEQIYLKRVVKRQTGRPEETDLISTAFRYANSFVQPSLDITPKNIMDYTDILIHNNLSSAIIEVYQLLSGEFSATDYIKRRDSAILLSSHLEKLLKVKIASSSALGPTLDIFLKDYFNSPSDLNHHLYWWCLKAIKFDRLEREIQAIYPSWSFPSPPPSSLDLRDRNETFGNSDNFDEKYLQLVNLEIEASSVFGRRLNFLGISNSLPRDIGILALAVLVRNTDIHALEIHDSYLYFPSFKQMISSFFHLYLLILKKLWP